MKARWLVRAGGAVVLALVVAWIPSGARADEVPGAVNSREMERALRDPSAVEFVDLGTLEGDDNSWPEDVNERGWVVGSSYGSVDYHAVLWRPGLPILRLEAPRGRVGRSAAHLSDDGLILVWSDESVPFLWWRGQSFSIQDQVPSPVGMNDRGDVVGGTPDGNVLWSRGRTTAIGGLGGNWARVSDVNDAQVVAGYGEVAGSTDSHPFVWHAGRVRDLGALPGTTYCDAKAISNSGIVVGTCANQEGAQLYAARDGIMRPLTPLAPAAPYPRSVNDLGAVVGASYLGGIGHAALWLPDGTELDLNRLLPPGSGYVLTYARAINNRFEIVGAAQVGERYHAFLLRPRRSLAAAAR